MDASTARISVITPCRNMGQYVLDAIASAQAQTLPVHEIIVVDDASDDGTYEKLQSLGDGIKLLRGPGKGSAIARNLAILQATGDWIAFLDADDLWYPTKLERQFADIAAKGADAAYTDYTRGGTLAEAGAPYLADWSEPCEGDIFSALVRRNFLLTSSVVLKRELLARVGLFKPALRGGQDIDLWLRVARVASFSFTREALTFYRDHGSNITSSPMYPYYHAQRWAAVYHEHSDLPPADREYIRERWGNAMFMAGRKAWWSGDYALARRYFEQMRATPWRAHAAFWRAVLALPEPLLRVLHGRKSQSES